ncbi:MAG: phosphohistidine phosphatase SixA [Isosphaeraceae bacterium]
MKSLYVLRHGIAVEPGTPGIPDDERPLTAKGEKRMRVVARGLRRLDLEIDRIVTSPLPRARSTAEIVADGLDAADLVETADILRAGSDAEAIQNWLSRRSEDRLMIVGHNPALSDLIALLVLGSSQSGPQVCELRKGGIAALETAPGSTDRYELAWVATPRLIRRLAGGKGE